MIENPDNDAGADILAEWEAERDVNVQADQWRGRTYDIAEKTSYRWHGLLTVALLTAGLVASYAGIRVVMSSHPSPETLLFIGQITGAWTGLVAIPISWWFGSSFGSRQKDSMKR